MALFLLALWLAAPALAWRASRRPPLVPSGAPQLADALALRRTARRTWRFFETFVTPAEHMLPPDNFQEDPKPVVAHRTSPTNVGLYLLSAVAARDFGWAGALQTCQRLEATFATLQTLERFRGHFYNWYDTRTTRVLAPAYVSSVDSGNLAGHLIALANACEEWMGAPLPADWTEGASDALALARESASAKPAAQGLQGQRLQTLLDDIDAGLQGPADLFLPVLQRLTDKAVEEARALTPTAQAESDDLLFWTETLRQRVEQQTRDATAFAAATHPLDARWQALARQARAHLGWTSPSCWTPSASCCPSAMLRWRTCSTPTATTCWRPKRGWPACSRSPRATCPRATGFAWAVAPSPWATDRPWCPGPGRCSST
jgi:cyclic beta-1,2-glucan synthetase